MIYWDYNLLSSEDASTTNSLDLLLGDPAEEPADQVHDENRLSGRQIQPGFGLLQTYGYHHCSEVHMIVMQHL